MAKLGRIAPVVYHQKMLVWVYLRNAENQRRRKKKKKQILDLRANVYTIAYSFFYFFFSLSFSFSFALISIWNVVNISSIRGQLR